jgi:hypothetical protein
MGETLQDSLNMLDPVLAAGRNLPPEVEVNLL